MKSKTPLIATCSLFLLASSEQSKKKVNALEEKPANQNGIPKQKPQLNPKKSTISKSYRIKTGTK